MGTSGTIQLYYSSQKRETNWLISLLVGVCLFLIPTISDAQLTVSCTPSKAVTCYGGADGEITVTASGGTEPYEYSTDGGTTWGIGLVIPGLAAGNYSIIVRDANTATGSCGPINITQPSEAFTLSVTTNNNMFCGLNGKILTITPSVSGVEPISYFLDTDPVLLLPINSLPAGSYTVSAIDANGCPASLLVVLTADVTAPVCNNFTASYLTQYSDLDYTSVLAETFSTFNDPSLGGNGNTTHTFDANDFSNVKLQISATQKDALSTWQPDDFLQISVSYDGGTSYSPLIRDYCGWSAATDILGVVTCTASSATSAWIDLPLADKSGFIIKVDYKTQSGNTYDVTLSAQGIKISSGVAQDPPSDCSDPNNVKPITFSDGNVSYLCPDEFSFVRTWTVTDNCDNSANRDQAITVGVDPTITASGDVTFGFCKSASITLTSPVYSDNCTAPDDLVLSWVALDDDSDPVSSGTGPIINYAFPQPVANDTTYTITWKVTDLSGFTATDEQKITFHHPLEIELIPPFTLNACEGDPASFTFKFSGGTGTYVIPPVFNHSGSWTPAGSDQGVFLTSDLGVGAAGDIAVTVTESGSCSTDPYTRTFSNKDLYTIHEKIATGTLIREP